MRYEVARLRSLWGKDIIDEFGGSVTLLFQRKSQGGLEKIQEGGLAGGAGTDDENTSNGQLRTLSRCCERPPT